SRRAGVPLVAAPVVGTRLADLVRTVVADGGSVLVLDGAGSSTVTDVPLPERGDVLVVVGPEGGISPAELAALTAAGGAVVRLGPHVLRTSTAGLAALVLLAQRLGRWG